MSNSISNTSFLDFFYDGSESSIRQEFSSDDFESEDGRTWVGWTQIVFVASVEDHVAHQPGAVGIGHPWYRMLKFENKKCWKKYFFYGQY